MVRPSPSIPVQNQQVHQAQQHQRVHFDYDIRTLLSLDLEFEQLGYIFKRSKLNSYNYHDGPQLNNRGFREAFGCSSRECSLAWLLVADGWTNRPKQATKIRFLWALSLLKTYDTETNMANSCGVDEKTFRKWAWFFIQELSFRIGDIIVWENRYVNDIGNDCLVSVDGTDFPLAWGSNHKRLSCYKFKGKPGLRYEVAVCLRTSDIVWTSGPHFPGLYNDLQIFREALIHMLDDGERVEADKGYLGDHPWYVKIPDGVNEKNDRTLLDSRQRSRHETVNNRFKRFGCMRMKFRHSIEKHGDCFNCVAILTQLSIDQGLGLFSTAYDDTLTDETAMIRNLPGVYNYYHILQEH